MIKVTPKVSVPFIPSNFSDEELVRVVRATYPELNGPLETLLCRFENGIVGNKGLDVVSANYKLAPQEFGHSEIQCEHCGSRMNVNLWEGK